MLTGDQIVHLAGRNGIFTVGLRYRDEPLFKKCSRMVKAGKLDYVGFIGWQYQYRLPPVKNKTPAKDKIRMTTPTLHIDFETRSDCDLKGAGVHRYAEHPSTAPWGFCWAFNDGAKLLQRGQWTPDDYDPHDVLAHVAAGLPVVAHNALFERVIWNKVVRARIAPHWPELKIEQQICTMARALALALPASLDALTFTLKTPVTKDKEGYKLMLKMCRPRLKAHVRADVNVLHWHDEPEMIERLMEYCATDVDAETLVDLGIPHLTADETATWRLDQKINDRGLRIDVKLVERALDVVGEAKRRADERMWWLTDGAVSKCTEAAKVVEWINARGIPCESVAKGEIEELICGAKLFDDEIAEEVIRLRRSAGKASTAKYNAMLKSVCADGRVRGTLQYHGATTGRWTGRLIQPQNFPRVDPDRDAPTVRNVISLLESDMNKKELCDALELVTDGPLDALSKSLRAMIAAGPGMKLVGGDFANIEGRVNAWLAGEDWKLDAFRAFDAGTGPDLYKVTAASVLGKPVGDITKAERQSAGKVSELALGYQGGPGAYASMAMNYPDVKLHEVAAVARAAAGELAWDQVLRRYDKAESRGLEPDVWAGVKLIVNGWRESNSRIVQGWWDLQEAAIQAVSAPGVKTSCYGGRVRYMAANGFLFCQLPSKRVLAYAAPRLKETESGGRRRVQVEYEGVDPLTRKWTPQTLYGGMQCNHVVQGTARDLIVHAMHAAENEGFSVVLTVHDELICEVVDHPYGLGEKELRRIMSNAPLWAAGLPIAAATWEDQRYVK